MTDYETILQLKNLREHCRAFSDGGEIWQKDIEALGNAIKILEIQRADGCTGCAFVNVEEWEMPCAKCKRGCKDYWRVKYDTKSEEV